MDQTLSLRECNGVPACSSNDSTRSHSLCKVIGTGSKARAKPGALWRLGLRARPPKNANKLRRLSIWLERREHSTQVSLDHLQTHRLILSQFVVARVSTMQVLCCLRRAHFVVRRLILQRRC